MPEAKQAKAESQAPRPEKKGFFKGMVLKKEGSMRTTTVIVQDNIHVSVLRDAHLPLELPQDWLDNQRYQLRINDEIKVQEFVADNLQLLVHNSLNPERLRDKMIVFVRSTS